MKKQGVKFDQEKLDWTLLPFETLTEVVKVLQFGADKYSRDNWKYVETERYKKALLRHVISYISGEFEDPESNFSHISHAICNLIFLTYKEKEDERRKNFSVQTKPGGDTDLQGLLDFN